MNCLTINNGIIKETALAMANVNITCLANSQAQILLLVFEASAKLLMPRLVVHSHNCPQHT